MKKMSYPELVAVIDNLFNPHGKKFTSEQLDEQLISFCLNCPDPKGAMDFVLAASDDLSIEEIASGALGMPARDVSSWSKSELAEDHPLRHRRLS